jgi:EpsD family peptidyl-prolyl cis-trans isomerase
MPTLPCLLRVRPLALTTLCSAVLLLATGCNNKTPAAGAPTQVAARVNKQEISVHQINFVLQRQAGLKPEQAEPAGRQVLERLIDQELAVQKAEELKLDRQPRVLQAMEAARREIVARAYAEHVVETAAKPIPSEIQSYYDAKPALFAQRRVYVLQELQVQAPPDQLGGLRERVQSAKSIEDVAKYIKEKNLPARTSQQTTAAENLPAPLVDQFAKLKPGQAVLLPAQGGARIVVVQDARVAPVSFEQATPRIEQVLLNDRKRAAVESDLKALRVAGKVEYMGKFAETAAAPAADASAPPALAEEAATAAATSAVAAASAASAADASMVSKGLSGLK